MGLVGSVFLFIRNPGAVSTAALTEWPGHMGNLESASERWPRIDPNEASARLTSLGEGLPKNNQTLDDFVAREITRDEISIGDGPALPDVSAIRKLLLSEDISWQRYDDVGDPNAIAARAIQMTMARALIAHALMKARANNAEAWDDLFAVWKLAKSLDGHPQLMTQTAALTMRRLINGAAWKMPLPVPAWLAELQSHDNVKQLLDAFQHQTASYWRDTKFFPTKWFAKSIEHDRKIAEDLHNFKGCDVNAPMNEVGTDLTSVWRRAFRYRAEREATANALRVREGKQIESASICSDGSWRYDGTTLSFSREIATTSPDTPMPLVLRVAR